MRRKQPPHHKCITLASGGVLAVTFDGNPFQLSDADRAFLFSIVDRLHAYEQEHQTEKEAMLNEVIYRVVGIAVRVDGTEHPVDAKLSTRYGDGHAAQLVLEYVVGNGARWKEEPTVTVVEDEATDAGNPD